MKKPWLCLVFLLIFLFGCSGGADGAMSGIVVPEAHTPAGSLDNTALHDYVLAYCWRSPERNAFGDGRTDIVVSRGDGSQSTTIVYPIKPPQSPVNLGCFGHEDRLRLGSYGLAWRPAHKQLTMVTTPLADPPGDKFYFVDVPADLKVQLPEQPVWQQRTYFWAPNGLAWSPDGQWLATLAENADNRSTQNIWLYNPDLDQGKKATDIKQLPSYVSDAVWSPDGAYVAVSYRSPRSGIGIVRLSDMSYIDISNENQSLLKDWPYKPGLFTLGSLKEQQLHMYLAQSPQTVWVDQGQRIVFAAPASGDRVALFTVKADGTDLHELLPGLPGVVGLPKLSPDDQKLAFVRYPGWNTRDRAEIAVVDLNKSDSVLSLAVLPAPKNGDELYISGLDWTPDGKFLAFSSNHEGQSDIYVMSEDEESWLNLTADSDGDAVNPVWRP